MNITGLCLSAMRALWGIVTPNLRKVSIQEKDILIELAQASTVCFPTWNEVARRLFDEINNQDESADVKLLRAVQNYKEDMILEFFQKETDAEWHVLNAVRNAIGNELGLNARLAEHDVYAERANTIPSFEKKFIKNILLNQYDNANRLVCGVYTKINQSKYDVSYYTYMVEAIKQRGIVNAEDYVARHFYEKYDQDGEEIYNINKAGVNFMLKMIGVLK